jgi:hypothetical protein
MRFPRDQDAYSPSPRLDRMATILQLANVQLGESHSVQKLFRAALVALVAGVLPAVAFAQSCNTADRSVLLILDASGSMNARLPNSETRMAVAQRAVKGVASLVPARMANTRFRLVHKRAPPTIR